MTRFLGITGHGVTTPSMHMQSLEKYDFHSILLPYNHSMMQNKSYASDFQACTEICAKRNIAIQTIKSIARGPLGDKVSQHAVWYDPLDETEAIEHAVSWVLSNPDVFLNTVGDIHLLGKVLEAASHFNSKPEEELMQADSRKYGITPLFREGETEI